MREMGLKIKMRVKNVGVVNNNIEKRIFHILVFSLGLLGLLYVLFLGTMVSNILARRNLEATARSLGNEVGSLELTYLSMSNNIDLNFSYALGFKEITPSFATRKSLGLVVPGQSIGVVNAPQNEL